MGVDLTILPTPGRLCSVDSPINFAHNLLWLARDYDLWDAIRALSEKIGREVPADFTSYIARSEGSDSHYGQMDGNDAYGKPLKAVRANDLGNLKQFSAKDRSDANNAVGCYLRALPPDWVCVLYWH